MKTKLFLSVLLFLCSIWIAQAKYIHLLPRPQKTLSLDSHTTFHFNRAIRVEGQLYCTIVENFLREQGATISETTKTVAKIQKLPSAPHPEFYRLTVTKNTIEIAAADSIGVLRAIQTLNQLAEGWNGKPRIEAVKIEDFPAFSWRGFMIDVGRSYLDYNEIKRIVRLLARFKVNVFHIHLTENQAWRLESKIFPQLNDPQFHTRHPGKIYTQAQMRELDEYCHENGMLLMPELDMPGHSEAFTRAMGFPMQSDQGVAALKLLLNEACGVFRYSPYFDIGADETRIKYKDFPQIILEHLHGLGRKVMAWNPGSFKLQDSGVDVIHLWSNGTPVDGTVSVDSRMSYINHTDVFADVVASYRCTIYHQGHETPQLKGEEVCLWTDHVLPPEQDFVRQYNFYAHNLARVERAWLGGGAGYFDEIGTMLPDRDSKDFKEFADWERRFLFHKNHSLKEESIPYVAQTHVQWRVTEPFANEGDPTKVFPPEKEPFSASYQWNGQNYKTYDVTGAGIYLRHSWDLKSPGLFRNPAPDQTAYAYTYIYSPKDQDVAAYIETQHYSRSDLDPAPEAGQWDLRGSRVWLNDKELKAPNWSDAGTFSKTKETPMGDENFTARQPYPISLKKGWNKVFFKLPYLKDYKKVRLQKWMFTFVVVDPAGKEALPGIIYSPDKKK